MTPITDNERILLDALNEVDAIAIGITHGGGGSISNIATVITQRLADFHKAKEVVCDATKAKSELPASGDQKSKLDEQLDEVHECLENANDAFGERRYDAAKYFVGSAIELLPFIGTESGKYHNREAVSFAKWIDDSRFWREGTTGFFVVAGRKYNFESLYKLFKQKLPASGSSNVREEELHSALTKARQFYNSLFAKYNKVVAELSELRTGRPFPENEVLRSCLAIIERRGENTNWEGIEKQVKKVLADHNPYEQPKKL